MAPPPPPLGAREAAGDVSSPLNGLRVSPLNGLSNGRAAKVGVAGPRGSAGDGKKCRLGGGVARRCPSNVFAPGDADLETCEVTGVCGCWGAEAVASE